MDEIIRAETRLLILQELAGQVDERLTASALAMILADRWWIKRGVAFVVAEIDYLAEVGGVTVLSADPRICELTERGRRHLDRSVALPGVKRPPRQEP